MPNIVFILRDGARKTVAAKTGATLMQAAKDNGIDIEGACGGAMACSTCHVIVDPAWYGRLPPPAMDETDMLDLAPHLTRTSRLGCQITLTDSMDGLTVTLPKATKSLLG
jgi:ferredoxin, 2Fe-2S